MAIRRIVDGEPGAAEALPDSVAALLIRDGLAVPANGPTPTIEPADGLPHIDERAEVLGLTDRDPEFFEKQTEEERAKAIERPPQDRMSRGGKRK